MNVSTYIDYFRQLAISHKDLQHDPDSETGDGKIGSKHFIRWSADEVVTGLKSTVSFNPAALLLELFEINTGGESPYDIKGGYKGAFTVLSQAKREDTASEVEAFETTERIYFDLLAKIYEDHYGKDASRDTATFKYFDFNSLIIMPISKLFDNEFGYRIEFAFEFRSTRNISTPPAEGTFI